jgi:hypothetical protein
MTKTIVFIDDQIPTIPGEDSDIIISNRIEELLKLSDDDWFSQVYLKSLIEKLMATERYKNKEIIINAFKHPSILLNMIEDQQLTPDVIIYDWEYETESHDSGLNLLDILRASKAFAFVYSSFFDAIPPTLNKSDFDEFSNRIQLLSKGDKESSIFSSEEFVVQYILGLFNKNNNIQLSNHTVKFNSSGYLEDASDIVYLEAVLGKEFILSNLEKIQNEISNDRIESLFDMVTDKLFISENNKYIIADNNDLMKEKYGPFKEISYKEVLKLIGIKNINSLLQSGIFAVK